MDTRTSPTRARTHTLPAVLSYGFRPFFLLAALMAALAVPLWLSMFTLGIEPAGPFPPVLWHAHEMLFGYLAAAMTGFALTAVPNWTGRLPVRGLPLAGLAGLFLLGRIASYAIADPWMALAVDGAFLVAVAAVLWREIIAGRNWRNLPIVLLFALFAGANLLFHLQATFPVLEGFGQRGALAAGATLICLIGGRIIPSFTRNWMVKAGMSALPAAFSTYDKLTVVATAAAVAAWTALPDATATGVALVAVGTLNLVRLARWRGTATLRVPIVVILHLGYLWLALALLLLAGTALLPRIVASSAGLHALAAGAIGTMTLAVMTRASLGHTGRAILAGPGTVAIYCLVTAGAILRVVAPFVPEVYVEVLLAGGALWSGAFALFALLYGPVLWRPSGSGG